MSLHLNINKNQLYIACHHAREVAELCHGNPEMLRDRPSRTNPLALRFSFSYHRLKRGIRNGL